MKKRTVFFFLVLCVSVLVLSAALADYGKIATDNGGTVNMRKSPDTKAKIITRIRNGSIVDILEKAEGDPDDWYRVAYGGKEGYIQKQYVKAASEAIGREIYSNGNTLYLRETPDENATIAGMLNAQQAMSIEQTDGQWALVSGAGVRGYVRLEQIDNLSDKPITAATQKWEEGILKKETKLYKEPNAKSEVVSTWPKGTGAMISVYSKGWCLVQIADEGVIGFAPAASVSMEPQPKETEKVDESKFTISASGAKKTAEKALKQYSGFNASKYSCKQETMYSCDGIVGPLYRFTYNNKKGQTIYAAYVHCYTGELLYKGDYSGFYSNQEAAGIRTAPPVAPTPEPVPAYDEEGNLLTEINLAPEPENAEHAEGTPMSEAAAREIADRYLRSRYPRFSEMHFTRINCGYVDTPERTRRTPYYQFSYFITVTDEGWETEELQYGIEIHAIYGDVESCSGPGEGNG